jgi:hypothetical protein
MTEAILFSYFIRGKTSWHSNKGRFVLSLCESMEEFELPWTKVKRVTTGGDPSII